MAKKQLGEIKLRSIVDAKRNSQISGKAELSQQLLSMLRPPQSATPDPIQNLHPVQDMEPVLISEPVQIPEPVQNTHPVQRGPRAETAPTPKSAPGIHKFARLIEVLDQLLPALEPSEQVIYLQLYRLSYGFGRDTCEIGLPRLATRSHTSLNTARKARNVLIDVGLVELIETTNTGKKDGGTMYRVHLEKGGAFKPHPNTGPGTKTVARPESAPAPKFQANMIDDLHDVKVKSHHQSEVMRIYEELTRLSWSDGDSASYESVKTLPIERIAQMMHRIQTRALSPPQSFAFYATSILKELRAPSPRPALKKKLKTWVSEISELHVGDVDYTTPDLVEDLKRKCAREGISWDNDLVNEVLGL